MAAGADPAAGLHQGDLLICAHCGNRGSDVILYPKLRNGKWLKEPECEDVGECLARRLRKTVPGDVGR